MTKSRLLLRNLVYFRAANLAVIAGMAVATAVLTGALMVGDSVRGSLRQMVQDRLGAIEFLVSSQQLFPAELSGRLMEDPSLAGHVKHAWPAMLLKGAASAEGSGAGTAGVQIVAVGEGSPYYVPAGQCVINGTLADVLGISEPGGSLLLSLPTADQTPRDAILARRGRNEVLTGLRVKIGRIERDPGVLSMFNLAGSQRPTFNVWVNLRDVQQSMDQPGMANLILLAGADRISDPRPAMAALQDALRLKAKLEDYALRLVRSVDGTEVALVSRSTYIVPAVDRAAQRIGIPQRRVLVYLANRVEKAGSPATVMHYSIVAGIDELAGLKLGDDEIALNQWAAEQLKARVGDTIRLRYYQRQSNGDLAEVECPLAFRIARILPMDGLGADKTLTPEYKGFTDADSIADWEPPAGVKIDKRLVTRDDEDYWEKHKAAPKFFVSLASARRLWGNTWGDLTSIRIPADQAVAFAAQLLKELDPSAMGLIAQPIKARQLAAAAGTTDFAGLFVGFSFFLIVAAAMLVAMLLRLSIEQRARQFGLLSALGFAPKTLQRIALGEGMLLAAIGGVIGVLAAAAYTALMIHGLRTWWVGAIGTSYLQLFIEPVTLVIGLVASLIIASLAITFAVWRVSRTHASTLLAGGWGYAVKPAAIARPMLYLAILGLLAGMASLLAGIIRPQLTQAAFATGGFLLLASTLILAIVRTGVFSRRVSTSIEGLGIRNASRHRARSALTVSLIAFASFILVTVASMRQPPPADTHDRKSGTGGFQLILQADVPLTGDLNTPAGRDLLGIRETESPLWRRARFIGMRMWAGQDASCLNITRPDSPTILAVPREMVDRNPFRADVENPWSLLDRPMTSSDQIPVIADHETAMWILKLNVGDSMTIADQLGRMRNLTLVATLKGSIFQGELLMSEANFLRLFPTQSGYGVVLAEAPAEDVSGLKKLLATELADYSTIVESTADRLARYQQVANTYLSTFQTLGALGLMLGTIGLAVVLLRGLVEQRPELALLSAIGFRPLARLRLVLAENAFLLVLGLLVGTFCALVGVLPTILSTSRVVNLSELAWTLTAVLALGLSVLTAAVWIGSRRIAPADLRAE